MNELQLKLCDIQGRLFKLSTLRGINSAEFIKLFMKSLKEYIGEGLLDRVKNKEVNHEILIEEFLKENYEIRGPYTIKTTNTTPKSILKFN